MDVFFFPASPTLLRRSSLFLGRGLISFMFGAGLRCLRWLHLAAGVARDLSVELLDAVCLDCTDEDHSALHDVNLARGAGCWFQIHSVVGFTAHWRI
jgi:hypothetical protein